MAIGAATPVTVTMKSLIGGVVAFIVAGGLVLWAVLTFTIGGIRDNVTDIRNSIHDLRGADTQSIQEMNGVNIRLTEQIQGLRTDFVKYSERFDVLSKNMVGLSSQIDSLQVQLKYMQTSWNDPKQLNELSEALKKNGATTVIVVPYGVAPPAP